NGWRMDDVIPSAEVVRRIDAALPCEPVNPNHHGEVAKRWRYRDGQGEFGIISSVTQAFCATCNRARLSTDGHLYTCLFAAEGYDLKSMLRGGASDDALAGAIAAVWRTREDRYSEIRTAETAKARKIEMSYIGG
ncbi:MAG: GTP 3',8-cyclase MoaA, partial [Betaproteobacteria bacterium]|nr:GTP 3',8-cyclase MoaA [Betaproteobacteria bacterium]